MFSFFNQSINYYRSQAQRFEDCFVNSFHLIYFFCSLELFITFVINSRGKKEQCPLNPVVRTYVYTHGCIFLFFMNNHLFRRVLAILLIRCTDSETIFLHQFTMWKISYPPHPPPPSMIYYRDWPHYS